MPKSFLLSVFRKLADLLVLPWGAGLCLIPLGVFGHLGSVPRFPTEFAGRDSAYRDHVVTLDPSVGGLREFREVRDDRGFAPLDRAKYSLN